jgi:hypothetical protein
MVDIRSGGHGLTVINIALLKIPPPIAKKVLNVSAELLQKRGISIEYDRGLQILSDINNSKGVINDLQTI